MQQSILISGITGFLGSHTAEKLINSGFHVIGLKRLDSDLWRCKEFQHKITWVNIDQNGLFKDELKKYSFETIVHAAWIGVESKSRDDLNEQSKNISLLVSLLEVAKYVGVKKFICFGSQAEYGNFEGKISEHHSENALNAYGSVKLACKEIAKTFCETNSINWIWLRLFSIFGEKENPNFLIPSLVRTIMTSNQMDFTPGNQKYAYLYVKDFALIMQNIVLSSIESGIYNVSANNVRTIKSLVEEIRDYLNPSFKLNFGALEYRKNQSMHMEGNTFKLSTQIGTLDITDFKEALMLTLDYYKIKY